MTKAAAIAIYECLAWHESLAGELDKNDFDEALQIFKSLADLRLIKSQIALIKKTIKSENSEYLTGYLCALSAVEGMINEAESQGQE